MQMGVLVSENRYRRLLADGAEAWRQRALRYELQFGVRTLVIPICSLDLDAGRVRAAAPATLNWQEELITGLPRVYYNLMLRSTRPQAKALRQLNGDLRAVIFNETNRWNRGLVFEILSAVPDLRPYVPPTPPLTPANLEALLSGERGLLLLAQSQRPVRDRSWLLRWQGGRQIHATQLPGGLQEVWSPADVRSRLSRKLRWITQLPGEPVGPAGPMEWRLYLHRFPLGGWQLAGAVAKHDLLRLPPHRERIWDFGDALNLTFGTASGMALADQLRSLALTAVEVLSLFIPGMAHCALDFWIDGEGRPMLADLSGRYRVDWLRRLGDTTALRRLLAHPVQFARTLEETGVGKIDVGFGRTGFPTKCRGGHPLPLVEGAERSTPALWHGRDLCAGPDRLGGAGRPLRREPGRPRDAPGGPWCDRVPQHPA